MTPYIKNIVGGEISDYTKMMAEARFPGDGALKVGNCSLKVYLFLLFDGLHDRCFFPPFRLFDRNKLPRLRIPADLPGFPLFLSHSLLSEKVVHILIIPKIIFCTFPRSSPKRDTGPLRFLSYSNSFLISYSCRWTLNEGRSRS